MCSVDQKPVFRDLSADDPDPEVTEIESLCMNCHANGTTRLLLTRIPYYKNVVIMSFSCEECGYENNEIQPGGAFAEMGVRWKLRVEQQADLNRQVVKSDYTCVKIPEIDLEIPAQSQKGEVTTVEGIISRVIAGLTQDQDSRREQDPEAAVQIEGYVERLQGLRSLDTRWTLLLDDITGNCFVENPEAPRKDPRCDRTEFKRSKDEDHTLGIFTRDEVSDEPLLPPADPETGCYDQLERDEVMSFNTNCPDCNAPADTNMKLTHIPHFKEVVIMATNCDACGHRTNEVKSGGGIEDKGVKFEVRVAGKEDFSRDILKSETCTMSIPELELEVGGRALGGRFSTAEGLLRATADQLAGSPELCGDAPAMARGSLDRFIAKLNEVLDGERAVTLVLDDPAGNSYVQSLAEDPSTPDDGVKITRYERTYEQNEELGLNDMKTEGYENS
ncbi:zinc finger protein ZPR1 [Amyelois transitella]|uniref:zinc finger protein ZPR1 n=1 Tax=Amyelois transitella TaxID=680683 RepID=UPI00298F4707|nr:zinc finger protein ZPR1 [Amyelois transitella]XP_060808185.1 zinc finger protein ZPR1 [Amyelois transitella]